MGKYADRTKETTTTTGTGALTLLGASTGFQSFASGVGVGSQVPYTISSAGGAEWEVGIGTLTATATLTRDTVLSSSNSNALVSFSAGTKDVYLSMPSDNVSDIGMTIALRMNVGVGF